MKTSEILELVEEKINIEKVLTIYTRGDYVHYVYIKGNDISIGEIHIELAPETSLGYYHIWSNEKYRTKREFTVSYADITNAICYNNYIIDIRASVYIIHNIEDIEEIFLNNNLKLLGDI